MTTIGRVAVDRVVAGEQADVARAVPCGQVGVLLVAQRLDRRGVEALLAQAQGQVDGELADDGLAGAGRGRDEDALAALERLAGTDLERVERELVGRGELRQCGWNARVIQPVRVGPRSGSWPHATGRGAVARR